MAQIVAPFTDNELARLKQWQEGRLFETLIIDNVPVKVARPPACCSVCNTAFVPQREGLHCPRCGTLQTWAPEVMAKMRFQITSLTAFVVTDPISKEEGVVGVGPVPMIAADEERIKVYYPMVKEICAAQKLDFRIVQFSERNDITDEIKKMYGD